MRKKLPAMFYAPEIEERVRKLAQEVDLHFAGASIAVVGILDGCFVFMADLIRNLKTPIATTQFIHARSYAGTRQRDPSVWGAPNFTEMVDRPVLVIDGILDTGKTMFSVMSYLNACIPSSNIRTAVMLNKIHNRTARIDADFTGFVLPDNEFVVGYGMDYNGRYRELEAVYAMEEE